MKITHRSKLLIVALVLCITTVVGSTVAWFTDTVESENNVITAGNLDIEVQYTLDGETWANLDGATGLFQKSLWEPGHTEVIALKIENKGTLAAKYAANMNIVNEIIGKTKDGQDIKLSDILTVSTLEAASAADPVMPEWDDIGLKTVQEAFASRDAEIAWGPASAFSAGNILAADTQLAAGAAYYVIVKVEMDETVGNEANHNGTNVPSIEFGLNVVATQLASESDSFGNDYDENAKYPEIGVVDIYSSADFAKVKEGDIINICANIVLDSAKTLPANTVLRGNGYQINGTIYAGGDLTIEGHAKVTAFSASYYNRTITIGKGACLEITGTDRMTLAYGNTFNITGTLEDAKTADKTKLQPSLIIPGGMSITGGNNAALNVTNAYVKIGSTTSKNSAANGTFDLNFTNSIAEFTNQLTLSEPTNGKNPTFNINIKDSVLTTGTKFIVAAPNSNVVIDNSTVALTTYFRNSGNVTLKNGSALTGSTIQFGENGGNDGTTIVDNSALTIMATSTGHALDGKGTGKLVLQNGATATVDYYKAMTVECDSTSTFTGTEVN